MKRLLRSRAIQYLLARLLRCYLWLILHTIRWSLDGSQHLAPYAAGAPAVFGFWHEHLAVMPALVMLARRVPSYRPTPVHALMSQHKDGQFVGGVVRGIGITPVLGSSSRGG